jgi:hypothetical protein
MPRKVKIMKYNFQDLTDKQYGKLKVLYRTEDKIYKSGRKFVQWMCECSCENKTKLGVIADSLRSGKTTSCGCSVREKSKETMIKMNTIHNKAKTRLYRIYMGMKTRCYNPNHVHYNKYGGKGIFICNEWLENFMDFYNWAMENGYDDSLSIDRRDNDEGYYPNNCQWSTEKEQQNNIKRNLYITIDNINKSVYEWAEEYKLDPKLISKRYYNGKHGDDLITPKIERIAEKQSGVKGVRWQGISNTWSVWGLKNNKLNQYLTSFKLLEEAIDFKNKHDKNIKGGG